jgi:antirestriction protein ArdC
MTAIVSQRVKPGWKVLIALGESLSRLAVPLLPEPQELIAELGSAFLSAHCRLDGVLEHASYLNSWLEILRADKRAIFMAAGKAQSASDYLLGKAGLLHEPETALAA